MLDCSNNREVNKYEAWGWVVAVIVLWCVCWFIIDHFIYPENSNLQLGGTDIIAARGQFGDKFGAINSLFTGLAFALLIYTARLQRKDLKMQSDELQLTRVVLDKQRAEFEEQNSNLRRQRFENTFFQMLGLHHQIVNAMSKSKAKESDRKGRQLLKIIADGVQKHVSKCYDKDLGPFENLSNINKAYNYSYDLNQTILGHYYRNLYRLIKFIDESDVNDKAFYTDIVRAQLSNQELILLFWNCLSDWGAKFKPLIIKYALFDNLPKQIIFEGKKNCTLYPAAAYGEYHSDTQ